MKKIKLLTIITYFIYFIISIRLFYLQIIERNYYLEKLSSKNNKIIYEDTSLRGRIYDKNNNILVDNKLIMTIIYKREDNMSINDEIKLAYEISKKIDLDYNKLTNSYLKDFYLLEHESEILKRLTNEEKDSFQRRMISNSEYYSLKKSKITSGDLDTYNESDKKAIYLYYLMNNGYSYMEKIIKENATIEEFMYFSENSHNLHGFNTKYTYGRVYPYNDTFKSILGKVGSIPSDNKDYYLAHGYKINDKVGLSNIELVFEDYLRGSKAIYLVKDNEKILIKEPIKGNDLKLTIDINLQKMVDDILKDEVKKAKNSYNSKYYNHSYVLITDTLGSILAMSGKEISGKDVIDIPIGNITDTVTPGSVVKGASMLVGFNEGAIKIGEVMRDECIKIKSTPKKCSIYNMGNINDINALAFSSNVYQFKTAIKVAKGKYRYNESLKIDDKAFDIYRNYFSKFGLGENTGIELLNESRGYKGSNRNPGLLLNFAIGQYDTYTNIQLNQYISTLANGKRYKMHILDEVIDNENNTILKIEPVILNELDIDEKYLNRVRQGLRSVISYGSGKSYTNLKAVGKTGTSESFFDSNSDGKIDKETISTNFVMYYPLVKPKFAISISSPNIGTASSNYYYSINSNVIKKITNNIEKYIK